MMGFSNDTPCDRITVGIEGDLPGYEHKTVCDRGLAKRQALSACTRPGTADAFNGQKVTPWDASWAHPPIMIYQKCSIVKHKCSSSDIRAGGVIEIPGQHQEDGA